jgi:hypothetical protein
MMIRLNPDFSRAKAVQEQGISVRRRSVLLRGLNNEVPVPLWFAFGEEFNFKNDRIHQNSVYLIKYALL